MHTLDETIYELRGVATKGVVVASDDTGQAQTVDVQTHDGITRTGIEVQQPFGFASAPPAVGSIVTLVAIGGDPGHIEAHPVVNPGTRFGNLQPDDGGCVYAADGSRVFVRAGGVVEVVGFDLVHVMGPSVTIDAPSGCTINAQGGCTINGPVSIHGKLTVQGDVVVSGNETVSGTVAAAELRGQVN